MRVIAATLCLVPALAVAIPLKVHSGGDDGPLRDLSQLLASSNGALPGTWWWQQIQLAGVTTKSSAATAHKKKRKGKRRKRHSAPVTPTAPGSPYDTSAALSGDWPEPAQDAADPNALEEPDSGDDWTNDQAPGGGEPGFDDTGSEHDGADEQASVGGGPGDADEDLGYVLDEPELWPPAGANGDSALFPPLLDSDEGRSETAALYEPPASDETEAYAYENLPEEPEAAGEPFALRVQSFGQSARVVPEPGALVLAITGLVALSRRRARGARWNGDGGSNGCA